MRDHFSPAFEYRQGLLNLAEKARNAESYLRADFVIDSGSFGGLTPSMGTLIVAKTAPPLPAQMLRLATYYSRAWLGEHGGEPQHFETNAVSLPPAPHRLTASIRDAEQIEALQNQVRTLDALYSCSVAATNRAFLTAIIDDDWLGARALAMLNKPMTVRELAGALGQDVDRVAVALAGLHRGAAVDAQGDRFERNQRGTDMLQRLDRASRGLSS